MISKRIQVLIRRFRRLVINPIISGMAVILPIVIFFFLARLIVNFISGLLAPMRYILPFFNQLPGWMADLLTFSIVLVIFFFIGVTVRTRYGGDMFSRLEEGWLMRLPFYSTLRETVRQFFGAKKTPFSQVVLVDVFDNGSLMTGFITDDEIKEDFLTVFVPTGPNPTNGFIFHVKKDKVKFLNTRPEDAMRTIIGMGTGSRILFD